MRRRLQLTVLVTSTFLGIFPSAAGAFDLAEFSVAAINRNLAATTQAGAHPFSFSFGVEAVGGEARDLRLHLPPGFLINPNSANECNVAAFHTARTSPYEASASGESCPNSTQVGVATVDVGGTVRHFGVFNLVPPFGTAAAIGLSPFGTPLVFTVQLRESDYGLDLALSEIPAGFDLRSMQLTIWGTPWEGTSPLIEHPRPGHNPERGNCLNEETGGSWGECLVFDAAVPPESQIKSYLTMPTTPCGSPLAFSLAATDSIGETAAAETTTPALTACNTPLSIVKVQLMTTEAAARTGMAVNVAVNDGGGITNPGGIARPPLKIAELSLPAGLTVNPSLAAGLGTCSEADFARETASSEPGAGCPSSSKIGTVTLEGTLGLAEPMAGSVYLATPHANPFGSLLAVYMLARNPRRGLIVKSRGVLRPNEATGQMEATFDELPRLLYTHFALTLREGQRSTLISPPSCGTYPAALQSASWTEPEVFRPDVSVFLIDRGEGGGACPEGAPPFSPRLVGGSIDPQPGAFTPFYLHMTRNDGEQEITSYSATFPPGLLGKIAGVATCSDEAIAAASHRSGAEEQVSPSCPAASSIGHTLAGYGVDGTLAWAPGGLYLAGPYHGAPLSVVAIDSALVGPFDLGTVVVRQAVRIDRRSAQVSLDAAGSDPIPHILDGIPLHLRDIQVFVDRPGFMVNPTSCDAMAVESRLGGAGANPFDPADDATATSAQRYQVVGCPALGFRPTLSLRLSGSVRHAGHPVLTAVYKPGRGANLQAVSVTLPPSVFLAQEHIDEVCTRPQFNSGSCPAGSAYGRAKAVTPLLETPLEGPVYLRSSKNSIPDLVADLHGRGIEIEVPGRIDSSRGGIRANFEALPDAPVTSFTMQLFGGKRSLITNAGNPCHDRRHANARFIAQSNLTAITHPALRATCKGGKKGGRSKKGGRK